MKVINIHTRTIRQPKAQVAELFGTLASKNDKMLATDKWPAMILNDGLKVGSKGGHGPIRYTVQDYSPGNSIQFAFSKPVGFNGFHQFEINEIDGHSTELKHTIDMHTEGLGTLKWIFAIRWMHDAFVEDAFDKVENHFTLEKKKSEWTIWVRFLRKMLAPKRK